MVFFIGNILVLDADDEKILKKGGIKQMKCLFQYATNIENFDRCFPDNYPIIVNVRYFIIHVHVNNYKNNNADLMLQDKETFRSIDTIDLE